MTQEYARRVRIGELIKRELSALVQQLARERAMGMISLTAVDCSPDLKSARIYFTSLGGHLTKKQQSDLLNAACPGFRRHLARHIQTRTVPRLDFAFDESLERGMRIETLLDAVRPPAAEATDTAPDPDPGAGEAVE
jgi:ribosome-binding factor A